MKTFSSRTLLAVRRERELVELSIVLYCRLRTGTGRECAELFTHPKNRETVALIKSLVSAYAALKDATEIPSEFFTTKILLRISMQIMVVLQARTRDPIAIFKRIYDREVAAQTHLREKDPYIIYAARVDEHFGFPSNISRQAPARRASSPPPSPSRGSPEQRADGGTRASRPKRACSTR